MQLGQSAAAEELTSLLQRVVRVFRVNPSAPGLGEESDHKSGDLSLCGARGHFVNFLCQALCGLDAKPVSAGGKLDH
jgi:hypothetical protein